MRTKKQELATKRNWNYCQLCGGTRIDKEVLTSKERAWVILIEKTIERLKETWKEGTIELGLKTSPFYKVRRKDNTCITHNQVELITDNKVLVKMYRNDKDYVITKVDKT